MIYYTNINPLTITNPRATISHILGQKMQSDAMFSVCDILKTVRDAGELACYPQVRIIVEMLMNQKLDYERTYCAFDNGDNGYFQTYVYHPLGADAQSYLPDRQLFELADKTMDVYEAIYLHPTYEELDYIFQEQGWYGIAGLFCGYESEAMKIIDLNGQHWGIGHAIEIKAGHPWGMFEWLKKHMIRKIAEDQYGCSSYRAF
jgi:hypothetical protein